jgi:hypothetical protein
MNRPSHKELFGKLNEARKAVEQEHIALLNQVSLAADAVELEYDITLDLVMVLTELLESASPSDYTGSRPPQRSYEQDIQGLELFAFTVTSRRFRCRVYFKFALSQEWFWLVSLHPDRLIKEGS